MVGGPGPGSADRGDCVPGGDERRRGADRDRARHRAELVLCGVGTVCDAAAIARG